MSDTRQEWINKRAYSLWEAEGKPHGRDDEHWQQALREREELDRITLTDDNDGSAAKAKAIRKKSVPVESVSSEAP